MANFSNNNLLGNQKRRNFIYNPVVPRSRDNSIFTAQPRSSTSGVQPRANTHHESPYKKFKSSHDLPDKRIDEIAAEEECRDIPLDAFDEEFDAIEDDFDDDDLLTAEQLDECDRIASMKLETPDFTSNLPMRKESFSSSSKNALSSSHLGPEEGVSDENDDTKNTQDYVVGPTACASSRTHFRLSDTAGFPVSNSRDTRVPIITHPQETASIEYPKPLKKSDSLLHSFVDQCNGSVSLPSSHVHIHTVRGNSANKTSVGINSRNDDCPVTRHLEDARLQNLSKEIERLKSEFATASSKVKTLEEEKFCKDGEIKILRDSLEHYQADEKKRQSEEKAVQEQQAREQSQHEKELEKQVENLTTQIRFKEREIAQMIEQNRKRTASLTEGVHSPNKKTVNLSEVFPTGSSFFQKTSPEAKTKLPRCIKQSSKDLKTQSKQNSQRLSEGENSENSALSGTSSGLSTLERMKMQQRETDVNEREIVQLFAQSSPEVELVQNLLSPYEKELPSLFPDPENRTLNEGSIISLLMLNRSANSHPVMQKTMLSETDVSHTLRLFETQATSKLQRSISTVVQKGSLTGCNNTVVMQTLSGLLNHRQVDNNSQGLTPTSNLKDRNNVPTAVNFLPLLENHIAHYVEQRTENNDDNILSTCIPRGSSPTQDLLEPKDSSGFETEHAKNLAALQMNALTALRLLNILVLYSCEVCECILKSATAYTCSDSSGDVNDRVVEKKGKTTKVKICTVFCMLFLHYLNFFTISNRQVI